MSTQENIETLRRFIGKYSRTTAWAGMIILLINAVLQVSNVLSRWLFSEPLAWAADIQEVTLPIAIAACFAEALASRSMIRISFLGAALEQTALGRHWPTTLNRLGEIALFIVLCAITLQLFIYASEVAASGRSTWLLQLPLAPTWYAVSLLFSCAMLMQFFIMIEKASAKHDL